MITDPTQLFLPFTQIYAGHTLETFSCPHDPQALQALLNILGRAGSHVIDSKAPFEIDVSNWKIIQMVRTFFGDQPCPGAEPSLRGTDVSGL